MTRTLRLDLEYDGTDFLGWQRQPAGRTVQGAVEDALSRLFAARTAVVGAGRTDAGVHARRMVASCKTTSTLPAREVARALDALLPEDVGVLAASDAPEAFHARRDARWKWYRYSVLRSRARRVFLRRHAWRVGGTLDVERLAATARLLVGRHDFGAFQSSGSPRRSTVRRLDALAVSEDGDVLRVDAVADGFLYGMVRAIVGTLVDVARGARDPASVLEALASRDRTRAGPAAPAHGLCLMSVGYEGEPGPPLADGRFVDGLRPGVESPAAPGRPSPCGSSSPVATSG
jgi:tRNA pseudouridine38-40 synthase